MSEQFVPNIVDVLKSLSDAFVMKERDYRKNLKSLFLEKKSKNQNYSLRAFARDLNISVTALHGVLAEERHLSKKNLEKLSAKFGWTHRELDFAKETTQSIEDPTSRILFEDEFKLISDWAHLAVLNLVKINGITKKDVAHRLNLSVEKANEILDRLERLNFISINQKGIINRELKSFGTSQNIPSSAIRAFHYQNLANAQTKLEEIPVEYRDFLTIVCATDSQKIQDTKKMIQEFRKKIIKTLESENPDQVYFMNLQLYPVTSLNTQEDKK